MRFLLALLVVLATGPALAQSGRLSPQGGTVVKVAASPGSGIVVTGTTAKPLIGVDTTAIQSRVTGTCSAGSSIRVIASDGSVTCEVDDIGTAGAGLTLLSGVFAIDPAYTQRRVTGTCTAGSSIRAIAQDGSVTCETDDAGITNSAGANVIPKSDGANLVASSWSDDGATTTTTTNLCIGATSCSDKLYVGGTATIAAGSSSAAAGIGGTVLTIRQTDGSNHYLTMQGTSNIGVNFATPSSGERGTVRYSSGADALRFGTAGTIRANITNNGTIQLGDSSNTAVNNNVDILTIGNTGTGQTTSGTALLRLEHTGTFDATSGDKEVYGVSILVDASRSAGSNKVTNRGLLVDAPHSGSDVGIAIATKNGWNYFNTDDGSSRFFRGVFVDGNAVIGSSVANEIWLRGSISRNVHYFRADTDLSCSSAACTLTDYSGDERGRIVCTDTNATGSCTVAFATAFTDNPPACILQLESPVEGPTPTISSISTSSFTFQFQDSGPQTVTYHCDGMTGEQ